MIKAIKFNVPSRGELGKDQIWRIYLDVVNDISNTEYVEHMEILSSVPTWTGELAYRVGYSLLFDAEVSIDYDPEQGYKYAVVHLPGEYVPKYTKNENGDIIQL